MGGMAVKEIIDAFAGANLWAWSFIVLMVVVLGAISNHNKRASEQGKATPKR
jgi:hypothetical protein